MTERKIRYSLRAEADLLACGLHWKLNHEGARATAFQEELEKKLSFIRLFPESYARGRSRQYRTARVAPMSDTGHLIVYHVRSSRLIEIVAILVSRTQVNRP
jgi:plasmid stabilization system protein ParE